MGDIAISTIVIIGLNVLISFKGFNDRAFFDRYSFKLGPAKAGEYIRFLSSGFLHVDTTHLLVNMITFYFFASVVIQHLGEFYFVIIYLGSLILGNLFSFFFNRDNPYYIAVGASGAVMGVLYSAILLQPNMMLGLMFIIPIPAYVFGIGYLLYSLYGMRKRTGNIGHDAHFGGAMGGYFLTLLMAPILFQVHTLMVILLAIPLVLLFVLHKRKAI
ncbi:MAG TPA: rhomboid family intramembrane serine protease [Flavobacteriaceae bacterium]|nr:rhomboid family intramembrane serine protease [Flavobacteriaceae bacterium]